MQSANAIGVAIIGLGTVGRRYVEQYQLHQDFEVVGGYDANPAAAAAAANDFGITIVEDPTRLVSKPEVDLVYVAVPPLYHEHYVDLVVAAGKALLCEKPLGVDDDQSTAMVQRVEASGIPAAVNFVFAAAPSAQRLIERLTDQQVHSASMRVHFEHWPRIWQAGATWLRDRDQGGWVREVVSHYLFLLRRLFGDASIDAAWVSYPADGTSEQGLIAQLSYGGVPVQLAGSSDSAGPDEVVFTVRGTARSSRLVNWYGYEEADLDGTWTPAIDPERASGPAAFAAQLDQMAALARGDAHTLATFAEALAVQRLAEALLDSAEGH